MNSARDPLEKLKHASKKKSETLDVDCTVAVGPTYENAKRQNANAIQTGIYCLIWSIHFSSSQLDPY